LLFSSLLLTRFSRIDSKSCFVDSYMPITTRSGRKLVVNLEEEEEVGGEVESSKKGTRERQEAPGVSEVVKDPSGKSTLLSTHVCLLMVL